MSKKISLAIASVVLFSFLSVLFLSCEHAPSTPPEQAVFDSIIAANVKDFNRYDWKAAAALFHDEGTYAQPYGNVMQRGRHELDSVMRDVMEFHKKDSLQADVVWHTKSLVVEDSMAYQVAKQEIKITAPGRSVYEGEETMLVVWKKDKQGQWKVHYQLVYP